MLLNYPNLLHQHDFVTWSLRASVPLEVKNYTLKKNVTTKLFVSLSMPVPLCVEHSTKQVYGVVLTITGSLPIRWSNIHYKYNVQHAGVHPLDNQVPLPLSQVTWQLSLSRRRYISNVIIISLTETVFWRAGMGLLSQFLLFHYFPNLSELSTYSLPIRYHVHIWQMSPQLNCDDIRQT